MATTTYGTTDTTTRTNPALYWGIALAVILAVIAFFALRNNDARVMPATSTGTSYDSTTTTTGTATTDSTPAVNSGAVTAPATMGTTDTPMNETTNMQGVGTGADAKSGSSMNTDTQSNSNNSNTGGEPTTEPANRNGQ